MSSAIIDSLWDCLLGWFPADGKKLQRKKSINKEALRDNRENIIGEITDSNFVNSKAIYSLRKTRSGDIIQNISLPGISNSKLKKDVDAITPDTTKRFSKSVLQRK
jgi:hypothetical protein